MVIRSLKDLQKANDAVYSPVKNVGIKDSNPKIQEAYRDMEAAKRYWQKLQHEIERGGEIEPRILDAVKEDYEAAKEYYEELVSKSVRSAW